MGADRMHLVNNNFDLPIKKHMLPCYSGGPWVWGLRPQTLEALPPKKGKT